MAVDDDLASQNEDEVVWWRALAENKLSILYRPLSASNRNPS